MEITESAALNLAGAEAASSERAKKASKEKHNKIEPRKAGLGGGGVFLGAVEKSREALALQHEGFPKEIAGLDAEDAAACLKEQADAAADSLREHQTPDAFSDYRAKVSRFLRYVAKNNFRVTSRARRRFDAEGRAALQYRITVINRKLDEMAGMVLSGHRDALALLARAEEIRGLIVDIMAS